MSPMPVPVTEKTGTRGLFCTRSFSDRCMKYSPSLPTRHVPSITAERGGSVAKVRNAVSPLAAVHQHEIQVGVVLPLLAYERLQRNAAVGIVGHQGDVLHLGIERTDQFDVAPDVVPVEHPAHPVQAVAHGLVVDRTGFPRLQRIGRRGQHDAVLAGEAAETQHPVGDAAQRHERSPRLLPQQHDGAQRAALVAGNQVVDLGNPLRRVGDALAFEGLDVDVARNARSDDALFEFGDETRHAARVGIVRRNDQNALAPRGLMRPDECRQQQDAAAEQQRPAWVYRVLFSHISSFAANMAATLARSSSARRGFARQSSNPASNIRRRSVSKA